MAEYANPEAATRASLVSQRALLIAPVIAPVWLNRYKRMYGQAGRADMCEVAS